MSSPTSVHRADEGSGRAFAHRRRSPLAARPTARRRQRGIALLELALVAMPLSMVIFSALDFGVRASYHNRLRNAAREGAALAEFSPGRITGCPAGIDDIESRIRKQDPSLADMTNFGFRVTTHPGGAALPMSCDLDSPPVAPGTKVAVEVFVDHDPSSPLSDIFLDPTVTAKAVVVVQG